MRLALGRGIIAADACTSVLTPNFVREGTLPHWPRPPFCMHSNFAPVCTYLPHFR
jgi:hypothetical protein